MVENEFERNMHDNEPLKDASSENAAENQLKQEAEKLEKASNVLFSAVEEKGGEQHVEKKMKEAGHAGFSWEKVKKTLLKGARLNI